MATETPQLTPVQQRVLDDLREDGIAITRFQDLFSEELWDALNDDIAPFVRDTAEATRDAGERPAGKEELIIRRFFDKKAKGTGEKRKTFAPDAPWLQVGASTTMLDVVNGYRGEWTKLRYMDNWFTVPFPQIESRVASQRWHRDSDEEHVVKVFLYFSDVDEGAGPFEYVKRSTAGSEYGDLWPWASGDLYPPQEEFERTIPQENRITLTGEAGTMIVCDTGGFHRGGFARLKPRILSIWSYVSPSAKKSRRRFNVDGELDELPPQVRFALD